MKNCLLVVLAALLAGSASAAEERVLALEGASGPLYYNGGGITYTLSPFVRFKNGVERTLTGVTVKVFQRPYMYLQFQADIESGPVGYRFHAQTEASVWRASDSLPIGYRAGKISSSRRTGTLAGGYFGTPLQMSGANNVTVSPLYYPQVDTEAETGDPVHFAYVDISAYAWLTDITFRRQQSGYYYDFIQLSSSATVVVIFTYNEMPAG